MRSFGVRDIFGTLKTFVFTVWKSCENRHTHIYVQVCNHQTILPVPVLKISQVSSVCPPSGRSRCRRVWALVGPCLMQGILPWLFSLTVGLEGRSRNLFNTWPKPTLFCRKAKDSLSTFQGNFNQARTLTPAIVCMYSGQLQLGSVKRASSFWWARCSPADRRRAQKGGRLKEIPPTRRSGDSIVIWRVTRMC